MGGSPSRVAAAAFTQRKAARVINSEILMWQDLDPWTNA